MLWLAAVPCLSGAVTAAETGALAPVDVESIQVLDEVVVTGDRDSLSAARAAIVDAEERFYDRWNELNEDDVFDIRCRTYIPTGSRFPVRVCTPRFVEEGRQAEAVRLMSSGGGSVGAGFDPSSPALMGQLKKRTLDMVRKDPELMRALLERARLEAHYAELRREKFKGRWIVWD